MILLTALCELKGKSVFYTNPIRTWKQVRPLQQGDIYQSSFQPSEADPIIIHRHPCRLIEVMG